mmetsp:Transcript_49685/g.159963  ORF Transcript_49685/g.159963 Transcript_49685/m.159963 type:complete len:765 (-) Transcript_49685:1390-3684(-)
MFWSLHAGTSTIDTLLSSEEGFTLEQLLDEDDLLQECKSQNTKLLDYLTESATAARLIDYVIEMPAEDDSEARRFKYPYVASEVLSCDVNSIHEVLLADSSRLVEKLLSILQQSPPLPPVLIGYAAKVLIALYKCSPESFAASFSALWEGAAAADSGSQLALPRLTERLMAHLGSDAVLQMLTVLCVGEPVMAEPGMAQQLQPPAAAWIPHEVLVPALFEQLAAPNPEAAQNASALLTTLLEASPALPACFCEPELEARERCETLLKMCLGAAGHPNGGGGGLNLPALDVLVRLLVRCREIGASSPSCADHLLRGVAESVDAFFVAIATPAQLPERISRFLPEKGARAMPRPQAVTRCKLLALFEEALRREEPETLIALCQLGFFHVVLDLLLLPHHCNALHMRTAALIDVVLSDRSAESAESAATREQVLHSLLVEAQLPQRLMECATASSEMAVRPSGHAYVMVLLRALLEAAAREQSISSALEAVEGWDEFVGPSGLLASWENVQSKPLGGKMPQRASDEDSDGDEYDGSRELERALQLQAQLRAQQENSSSGEDSGSDGEGPYLEHFAQLLSQRNFVNDMGAELDEVLQDGSGGGASAQWDASFDDDEFDTEPLPAQPLGAGGGTASFADFGASAPAAPAADFAASDFAAFDDAAEAPAKSDASPPDFAAFGDAPAEAPAAEAPASDFAAFDVADVSAKSDAPASDFAAFGDEDAPAAFAADFGGAPEPTSGESSAENAAAAPDPVADGLGESSAAPLTG